MVYIQGEQGRGCAVCPTRRVTHFQKVWLMVCGPNNIVQHHITGYISHVNSILYCKLLTYIILTEKMNSNGGGLHIC